MSTQIFGFICTNSANSTLIASRDASCYHGQDSWTVLARYGTAGSRYWRVLYTAGFDPVPEDVQACAQIVAAYFWQTRRDPGLVINGLGFVQPIAHHAISRSRPLPSETLPNSANLTRTTRRCDSRSERARLLPGVMNFRSAFNVLARDFIMVLPVRTNCTVDICRVGSTTPVSPGSRAICEPTSRAVSLAFRTPVAGPPTTWTHILLVAADVDLRDAISAAVHVATKTPCVFLCCRHPLPGGICRAG